MAKFGFDIHGVLDKHPGLLFIMEALVARGHEVHVLTGAATPLAVKHLKEIGAVYGMHYNMLFSITDYLIMNGHDVSWRDVENPVFANEPWDRAKAEYCKNEGLCMLVDDSPVYGRYFAKDGADYLQVGARTER